MSWVVVLAWAAWWLCTFQLITSPICFLISTMGTMTGKHERDHGRCLHLGFPVVEPATRIPVKVKDSLSSHISYHSITYIIHIIYYNKLTVKHSQDSW